MGLWSVMLDRDIEGKLFEDNMSTIEVIKVGYSSKMRHLAKHHRISVGIVHEFCQDPMIGVNHVSSDKQKGDLMTKGLARPKHEPACRMVGLYPFILEVPYDSDFESNCDEFGAVVCSILDKHVLVQAPID